MRKNARIKKVSVKWNFKMGKFAKEFIARWRNGKIFDEELMAECEYDDIDQITGEDELCMVEKEMGITWGDKTIAKERIISTDDYSDFISNLQLKGW